MPDDIMVTLQQFAIVKAGRNHRTSLMSDRTHSARYRRPSVSQLVTGYNPKFATILSNAGIPETDQCYKDGISGRVPLLAAKLAISPYIKQDSVEFLFRKSNRIGSKKLGILHGQLGLP